MRKVRRGVAREQVVHLDRVQRCVKSHAEPPRLRVDYATRDGNVANGQLHRDVAPIDQIDKPRTEHRAARRKVDQAPLEANRTVDHDERAIDLTRMALLGPLVFGFAGEQGGERDAHERQPFLRLIATCDRARRGGCSGTIIGRSTAAMCGVWRRRVVLKGIETLAQHLHFEPRAR